MNAEQFETEALPHLDDLYRYALRLSRRPENAEDLVQETFARAFKTRERLTERKAIRPTLFRILHNLYVDEWRARTRGPLMISTDSIQDEYEADSLPFLIDRQNPRDLLLQEALSDEIEEALAGLDEAWRQTILLREIEEFSYEEISRITEVPIGTVRSRLARARKALAEKLDGYARVRGHGRRAGTSEDGTT